MPEFSNLPGSIVVKEDNNLTVLESIPGDVTLIIGTAPDGPLESLYPVYDSGDADRVFDPTATKEGTLLRGMYEALEGGAQNVILFRIGAKPEAVVFLNGWTILRKDTSDLDYQVYYNCVDNEHTLRIYESLSGAEVYNSLTGVDTGALTVLFDANLVTQATGTLTVGTPSAPVSLADIDLDVATAAQAVTWGLGETFFAIPAAGSLRAGMAVEIAGAGDVDDNGLYLVLYKDTANLEVHLSHKWVNDAWVSFAGFEAVDGGAATAMPKATYYPENNGTSLTYIQLYEALAKAYWALEAAKIDMVIPMGIFHDAPNLVNNLGVEAIPSEADFLGKVYQFEHNGDLHFIWQTDLDAAGDVVPSPYSLQVDGLQAAKLITGTYTLATFLSGVEAPVADISFTEVNFSHQLATYLHELSVNDNEAIGVAPMLPPKNYSRQGITTWLGIEPTYDSSGSMIISGTGLLGDKWMVGSTGHNVGFFATGNGLAGGTALVDGRTRQKVDIGKYLSIVATPLISRGSYATSTAGYIAAAAAIYGGFIQSLPPQQAPTNKILSAPVNLAVGLKKVYLDKLVGAKYICFTTSVDGRTKCVDAPTAALSTSDYRRLLTVRCVWATIEIARAIAEPFIGGMYTGEVRNALEEQENNAMVELQKLGLLQVGKVEVRATRAMEIKGEGVMRLTLKTPGELRKLIIEVALSK